MNEIIKLKELREKLKQQLIKEQELFDNAKDIKSRGVHLDNINKLHIKLGQLSYKIDELEGTYIEDEDSIKAHFGSAATEELGFGGIFRHYDGEEY